MNARQETEKVTPVSLSTGSSSSSAARAEVSPTSSSRFSSVPKLIWMLWFDGWSKAPELHHRCRETWELFNPDWEVRAVSREDFPKLLGDFLPTYDRLRAAMNPLEKFGGFWIPPAAESDLLRLILLGLYGGVWVDSTMLCRRPLDEWLPSAAASGFFAYSPEDIAEELPVMSSFLVSEPGHKVVAAWLRRTVDHWSTPSSKRQDLGFFWLHKLFGQLVGDPLVASLGLRVEAEIRRAWMEVPKISGEYGAPGPHFWVKYNDKLRPRPTAEHQRLIEEDTETPMCKLTNHEVKLHDVGPESCYWVLLEDTRRKARDYASKALGSREKAELAIVRRLLETGDAVGWC